MEGKPKGFLLTWKLRSLRILVALIYVFAALFLTFLNVRGYYRGPDSFTVKAVFPVKLSDVMETAKARDSMPDNLAIVPGEVSDLLDTSIVEAYRVIECFPNNEFGSFLLGYENVCDVELYVWRGDGLPTLYVKTREPLAFVDQASYEQLTKPVSFNKYYAFGIRSTPEVFGNVVVQTFHKTSILNLFFFGTIYTLIRLFLVWVLHKATMYHVKEYRADKRVYDLRYE